jgi:glycerol-1-phosphate dehydrogenase [NAD(P)+]
MDERTLLTLKLHRMQLPREVLVGRGTLELVSDTCKKLGFSKTAFVVAGEKTLEIAGRRVIDSLEQDGMKVADMLVTSPTMWNVRAVEMKIQKKRPQLVLGIGGGAKIDVAKLSSAHRGIPYFSIPTTASHDGIASPLASIKGLSKPFSVMAQSPMAIIADTDVIMKSSQRLIASGCGDVIAKITAVRDWRLAHKVKGEYYGAYAASLALMSAKLVMENADLIKPNDEEGLHVLLEALISCGVAMAIAGSSRPGSGGEHMFSHALDSISPNSAMHGEQCGVGTILMAYLYGLDWRRIRDKLKSLGAPTTAKELDAKPSSIVQALVKAREVRPERYTILQEKMLDENSARKVAETTDVI